MGLKVVFRAGVGDSFVENARVACFWMKHPSTPKNRRENHEDGYF